ncbi:Flp pilus assembly pilin Flp [Olsenella profusa DSM 13989]|nr:Flp pilus assembly pilin Flp [Olsenella profusa DSM 13989]
MERLNLVVWGAMDGVRQVLTEAHDQSGQGTTEYAILVGVLVVIAILSIITFRGKIQELWDAIASGIGSL